MEKKSRRFSHSFKMKISECKEINRLPHRGTKVHTDPDLENDCKSFFVAVEHIKNRKKGKGQYYAFVPGSGGDLWWIKHEDGSIAAYSALEVFDL